MKNKKVIKKLDRKNIRNINDLYLWHNNPRLVEEFGEERPMNVIGDCQDEVFARLGSGESIPNLIKSILSNGWLGYDPIVVASLSEKNKFVVLEGNRRVTALKTIFERAKNKTLTKNNELKYDEEDIVAQIKEDGLEVFNAGDYDTLPLEIQEHVDRILNVRHLISQEAWLLHRKAFQVFKKYMVLLSEFDPSVPNTDPKSFYLENDLVTKLGLSMGEKDIEIRKYLYIHRLRCQLDDILTGLGSEFPKDKTSYIEEFISKPDLRRRFGFDAENGTISSGELSEKFCKTFFDYPGNTAPVRAAASGDASLRDYAYVVKKDPTDNDEFINMIEEDQQVPSEVKSRVVHRLGEFALEAGLVDILSMCNKIKLGDMKVEHFDSDRTREVVEEIFDTFDHVQLVYNKWKDKN